MSPTQSAENSLLSMDGAEDAEVGSGTSSTIRSARNLPSDMAKDAKVGSNSNGGDDKTIERSPLSKKSSRPIGYLTFLRFDADSTSPAKR